ncbi:MAG TPA: VTT domain-containing protein [Ilumatobacteraceae bacterium]|nr:VTT domain-containing protein [Ilumatobacteraceae bacterium]
MLALFDIQSWLDKGGLALAALIVFAETGLLIGFFLPGDSLLFVAGFLSSKPEGLPHLPPIWITAPVLIGAAFLGNQVGFWIGRKFGPAVFDRPDSRFFSQKNVVRTQEFFEKYGTKALVLARFVPIVRTFVPVMAGVGNMNKRTFVVANLIGAVLWAGGLTVLGYYLGQVEVIKENIELAAIVIVGISLIPVGIELIRHRREARKEISTQ